jgi:hypothetical protein
LAAGSSVQRVGALMEHYVPSLNGQPVFEFFIFIGKNVSA